MIVLLLLFGRMVDWTGCKHRVQAYLFSLRFPSRLEALRGDVDTLADFCADAKTASKLNRVMEMVLAYGNYLNGGSSRGGAYGFKMTTLLKLKDVKATSSAAAEETGCSTFLEFLVKQCLEKHPELLEWATSELKSVVPAERLSLGQLEGEIQI